MWSGSLSQKSITIQKADLIFQFSSNFFSFLDFPLDVNGISFSYNAQEKPRVQWNPIEGGNCLIGYSVQVFNSTGHSITKKNITGTFVTVEEFEEPSNVIVRATNNFTPQVDIKPDAGNFSHPVIFTKTTTTKATTTG